MLYKLSQKKYKMILPNAEDGKSKCHSRFKIRKGSLLSLPFWIVVANNCTKSFELSTYSKHNTTSRLESSVISAFNNYWKLLKYVSHPARFGFRRGHHKRKKYVQTSFKIDMVVGVLHLTLIRDMEKHFLVALPARAGRTNATAGKGLRFATVAPSLVWRPKSFKLEPMDTTVFHF